jgi:hypothetical protein
MTFNWTEAIEEEILGRIASGESVMLICGPEKGDWLPTERTFYRRIADDAAFCQRYARAREAQGHREADEIKAIADAATVEDVHVARLKIDARKWRASKLAPKVYGDKLAIGGADDLPPVQTINTTALSAVAMREILEAMDATPEADEG